MLLRQTITTTRGRHNHLLTKTARLSQRRHDAARSTTRAGVTANIIINRRQKYSSLLFWRNSNSLISAPPPAVLAAKASSCSSSLQQQRQYYGNQSNDYYKSTNQAAFTTTAALMTAAMATVGAATSSRNDDDSTIAFNSTQFCSSNNISSSKNICHCEATAISKESQSAKLTATSSTTPYNINEDDEDNLLPTYTMSQVANFNGQLSPSNPNKRIWMSYGGLVYDVTEFVANHPGGSEKILMGAGGAIEPYWYCEFIY